MPNVSGRKWGSNAAGSAGGVVTWSIVGAGESIDRFQDDDGVSVDPSSIISFDFVAAISNAFAAWSNSGNIEFMQVEDQGGAAGAGLVGDIRIYFGPIPGSTIGIGYYPSSFPSGITGDILMDSLPDYNSNPALLTSVLLHEMGHALGLGHVSDVDSIMTASLSQFELQADDINGIQQIYGVQDNRATVYDMASNLANLNILESSNQVTVNGNALNNNINGTSDQETINGGIGDDTLDGGLNDDHLNGGDGADWLQGNSGADVIYGGIGNDEIRGGRDNDRLFGEDGNDTIYGALGDDTLDGGLNDDLMYGGDGADWLQGNSGADVIYGGAGNDEIRGGRDNDRLYGDNGNDTIYGARGDDTLDGGLNDDLMYGGSGADDVLGNSGADVIYGGAGNDTLRGGRDNDEIHGGDDDDRITGALGNDTLSGDGGADTFVFTSGFGTDIVLDYEVGTDKLSLDDILWGGATLTAAQVISNYARFDANNNVVLDFGAHEVTLIGVTSTTGLDLDLMIF